MPRYANGFIPRSELVLIEGNHWATRGTAARWEMLKADVLANEGVRLRITGGENAYRSFAGQQFARAEACRKGRCDDAAVAGFSSHGGSLNGRDSGAIDVSNWSLVGQTKFYAYCRRNGFEPGYFDWEPWHIIDWAPYTLPTGGGSSTPGNTTVPQTEDNGMILLYITDNVDGNNKPGWALYNTDTGKWIPRVNDGSAAAQEQGNSWSRALGQSANWCTRQDALNLAAGIRGTK